MVVVLILTFLFLPPLAPIALIIFLIYKRSKQDAPVEDKTVDHFGEKFIRHMQEEADKGTTGQKKTHGHTPISYSYDSCAAEKRLEQLKVLKSAGLLDEVEYQQRREAILK